MPTRCCARSRLRERPAPCASARSRPAARASGMSEPRRDGSGPNVGVLISGRGSNLQSLIDAVEEQRLTARIAIVISNRPGVVGLVRARAAGIETVVMEHRGYPSRDVYDRALADALRAADGAPA